MSGPSPPPSAGLPESLDCTAIVSTVDRPGLLEFCLASLAAQRPRLRELVVVDQGPGEAERIARAVGARHLHLAGRGLSRARNAGLALAGGEWLFFPDDDCTVAPGFAVAVADFVAAHPEADFLCARVQTPEGRPLSVGMGGEVRELRTPRAVLRTALSAGLLLGRRALERGGNFDERFGVGARFPSGEESDLLFRALAAGCRGFYVPGAVVLHPPPFDARDGAAAIARAFEYGRGWGALFAKHGTAPLRPRFLLLHLHYLLRAAGGALLAALGGRGAVARRYFASLRGRWTGFLEYRRERRQGARPAECA